MSAAPASTPTGAQPRSPLRRVGETCLWLILIAVVVVGAVQLASTLRIVVLPTFLALILATLLTPPVRWLGRHRFPPAAASLVVVAAFVLLLRVGGLAGTYGWSASSGAWARASRPAFARSSNG